MERQAKLGVACKVDELRGARSAHSTPRRESRSHGEEADSDSYTIGGVSVIKIIEPFVVDEFAIGKQCLDR